jgi:hypothetical protein
MNTLKQTEKPTKSICELGTKKKIIYPASKPARFPHLPPSPPLYGRAGPFPPHGGGVR